MVDDANGQRLSATYYIETPFALEYAAKVMAGEQSTGTFLSIPGEIDEIKRRYGARIESIKPLENVTAPSLPGARMPHDGDGKYHRGEVVLSFPFHNFGPNIPNLMATICGNLYELEEFSGLRLIDIDIPAGFKERYPGPKFGIAGTRELTGVYGRPMIGTIIKPNIGLNEAEFRNVVRDLAEAGIDFIKDDEINGSPLYAPLEMRVKTATEEIERAADKTGKKTMYAFNITDDIDRLRRNHDLVVEHGGTCVMVSINSIGLAGVAYLNQFSEVPIHGHRNQWGMMTRAPLLGMDFRAYQKLCRLAGTDHLHVNGLNNKFFETNESIVRSVNDCMTPLLDGYPVLPVLSSKQWAGAAPETYTTLNSVDLLNIAGGGIHAHPGGVAAGYRSLVQGWEAALSGVDLNVYAESHIELKQAMEKFGGK